MANFFQSILRFSHTLSVEGIDKYSKYVDRLAFYKHIAIQQRHLEFEFAWHAGEPRGYWLLGRCDFTYRLLDDCFSALAINFAEQDKRGAFEIEAGDGVGEICQCGKFDARIG